MGKTLYFEGGKIMRELLFRGQTRRYGEKTKNVAGDPMPSNWVYGGIFHQNNGGGDFSIIYSYDSIEKYIVYADTVGQYTGMRDKNDKKIFEGDIVRYVKSQELFTVEWHGVFAQFVFFELKKPSKATRAFKDMFLSSRYYEVIGNIYDNPELLKNSEEA